MTPTPDMFPLIPEGDINSRYMCCCQKCPVKLGAIIVASMEAVFVFIHFCLFFHILTLGPPSTAVSVFFCLCVGNLALVGLALAGLWKERPAFLIPYYVLMGIRLGAFWLAAVAVGVACAVASTVMIQHFADMFGMPVADVKSVMAGVGAGVAIVLLLAGVLQLLALCLFLRAYRFIQEKLAMTEDSVQNNSVQGPQPAYPNRA